MNIEPRSLNIPLNRRRWGPTLLLVAGCGACAWLSHQPKEVHAILVALLLGTPAFWVGFGPALLPRRYELRRDIHLAYRIGAMVLVFSVMKWLVPAVTSAVGGLL